MKTILKSLLAVSILLLAGQSGFSFEKTLRADYIFSGDCSSASISLSRLSTTPNWYGRTVNMDEIPVAGNGQIRLIDEKSGETIYANSFSTLFQEWQATPEAKQTVKAFENTFLLPMPDSLARVEIVLFDSHGRTTCEYSHIVDPSDILIASRTRSDVPCSYIHKGGDPKKCIDVAIIAEGYTEDEMAVFYEDARATVDALSKHEPFASTMDRFNFLAVAPSSKESGVSVPRQGDWKSTPLQSHFDTFYSDRYLTTLEIFAMHDLLEGLPYEHIIILANTNTYGGGGIYNSYTLTTAHHPLFRPVVVHEFGHSFGALADEYAYAGQADPYYFPEVEPWEQNITTQANFESKWKDMISAGVEGVGLFEGAGYQEKGVWRPVYDCRMRTNQAPAFCPVCQRAIERVIDFNTK